MNYIVITVILTAVCAAYLFAQESDEISREMDRQKPRAPRSGADMSRMPGRIASAAGETTAYAAGSILTADRSDTAWKKNASRIAAAGSKHTQISVESPAVSSGQKG